MSIIKSLDVSCDGEDCANWTEGCVSGTPAGARSSAHRQGWTVKGGLDLCPGCSVESSDTQGNRGDL